MLTVLGLQRISVNGEATGFGRVFFFFLKKNILLNVKKFKDDLN